MGAGTDANVFLIIYGEKGQSGKMNLKQSTNNSNPFEKGKKDIFKLATPNIGEVTKINLSHDGAGPGAGWYVESIVINNLSTKKVTTFPISRWLDSDEGDKKLECECLPNVKPNP